MKYLFNSSGNWIAFKIDSYLFNSNANWIGWFPWDDEHAVDKKGNYLGSIFDNDRFYKILNFPYRGYPGYPGYAGYSIRPQNTKDYTVEELKKLEKSSISKKLILSIQQWLMVLFLAPGQQNK